MPWKCGSDGEFLIRITKFINVIYLKDVLLLRLIHPDSLTQSKKLIFLQKKEKKNNLYKKENKKN